MSTNIALRAAAILELRRRENEAYAERCRTDLAFFVREMWHVLEPSTPLVWNWHLDVICRELEYVTLGWNTRLIVEVPPGHMKSLLATVFWPAWEWLTKPDERTLCATYALKLTLRDAHRCRELLRSDEYRALIPRRFGRDGRRAWEFADGQDAKGYYENTERGFRLSTSVDGDGTGHRGRKVVIDDAMNVIEWPSPERLDAVWSWFNQRMSSRLNDMATGAFVVIAQRIHENDLIGRLLAEDARNKDSPSWVPYRVICLSTEFDPDAPKTEGDPRIQRGELLFPAKFPADVVARIKIQLGPFGFAAQHQQRPFPSSGGILRPAAFRFWYPREMQRAPAPYVINTDDGQSLPCPQVPLPERFDMEALSWDMAFKGTDSSDFVVGQHWAKRRADLFLLTQVHAQLSFTETCKQFVEMVRSAPRATAKYVEDKANGPAVISTLEGKVSGLVAVEPKGGKEARAHAASPVIEAGNVYLPHPDIAPWVKDVFLPEVAAFPRGAHDDQVDAMTQAILEMAQPSFDLLSQLTRM